METIESLYSYFDAALHHAVESIGRGALKVLSIETGVSRPHMSQIVSKTNKKKASLDLQKKIAKACGYPYQDFLSLGKGLIEGNEENIKSALKSISPLKNKVNKEPELEGELDSSISADKLIEQYAKLVESLQSNINALNQVNDSFKQEIKELKQENKEQRSEIKELINQVKILRRSGASPLTVSQKKAANSK